MKRKVSKAQPARKQRRTRSTPGSLPVTESQTSWSENVKLHGIHSSVARRCPKCTGLLMAQVIDLTTENDIRCINCGWQPQWGTRVVSESDEVRSIRRLTAEFCTSGIAP
ncbi:MAG: hypothetical protein MRJ96_06490 [Nitrospirales bacterium]|nr:hypothetical protein [Nitrospira sp.]MDR4501081.1 hypothetical protein [Nitrospirales bacterium]